MGFFLVLVMEQITLAYKEQSGPPPREETRALLGTVNGGPQHWHDGLGVPQAGGASSAPSALRACVLVFSLALHSVFEGLAVGLQRDQARAMELCLALLLHKGILAVSLSLRLLQSHLRAQVVAGCGILYGAGRGTPRRPPRPRPSRARSSRSASGRADARDRWRR